MVMKKEIHSELVHGMKTCFSHELIAVWDSKDRSITCYALDEKDLENTVKLIKTTVVEKVMEVDDSALTCIDTPNWSSLMDRLSKQYTGTLDIKFLTDKQALIIITLSNILELICEEIVNFFKDNTLLEQFLKLDFGTARLIKQFMSKRLKSLCENDVTGKVRHYI